MIAVVWVLDEWPEVLFTIVGIGAVLWYTVHVTRDVRRSWRYGREFGLLELKDHGRKLAIVIGVVAGFFALAWISLKVEETLGIAAEVQVWGAMLIGASYLLGRSFGWSKGYNKGYADARERAGSDRPPSEDAVP